MAATGDERHTPGANARERRLETDVFRIRARADKLMKPGHDKLASANLFRVTWPIVELVRPLVEVPFAGRIERFKAVLEVIAVLARTRERIVRRRDGAEGLNARGRDGVIRPVRVAPIERSFHLNGVRIARGHSLASGLETLD